MRHLVCAAVLAIAAPASAQIDISGNWISSEENLRPRGNAGIGDYTGLPLNDAGRLRADTWDASILSQRERQTEPHGVQYYQFRSPARIEKVLDPATRQLVAYTLCCEIGALERVVWLDGRPHPPEYAERTWEGFSTGRWVGNTLTVTTTHLRASFLERNGAPASHKSTGRRALHASRRPVDRGVSGRVPARYKRLVARQPRAAKTSNSARSTDYGHQARLLTHFWADRVPAARRSESAVAPPRGGSQQRSMTTVAGTSPASWELTFAIREAVRGCRNRPVTLPPYCMDASISDGVATREERRADGLADATGRCCGLWRRTEVLKRMGRTTMATAAVIAVLAVPAAVIAQREAPAEERPAFEAATVKLAAPDAPAATRNRVMQTSPNRLNIPSMTLTALIYAAYGDGGFNTSMRVTGGPDWVNRTAFAVEGVASGPATPRQMRLMLQRLLDERFALKIRNVTQTADSPSTTC